jgi:hypothetical protein
LGYAVKEGSDALHLIVEFAALHGGEAVERLYRDGESPAGAALVPDSGDYPVDKQHRKIARLATGTQGTCGGGTGEEQRTRLAAHHVGVEVGQ